VPGSEIKRMVLKGDHHFYLISLTFRHKVLASVYKMLLETSAFVWLLKSVACKKWWHSQTADVNFDQNVFKYFKKINTMYKLYCITHIKECMSDSVTNYN